MKKQFFIHDGTEQTGPFTIDEIGQKGITAKTMIWFEGIQTWTEAQFIPELKDFIIASPPPFTGSKQTAPPPIAGNPFPSNSSKEPKGWLYRNKYTALIIAIGIILVLYSKLPFFKNTQSAPMLFTKVDTSLDSLTVVKHSGYAFINADKSWFIELDGQIMNRASITNYKDFVVEVKFISATQTVLGKSRYTVFESVAPLMSTYVSARLNGVAPYGTSTLDWKLLNATPYVNIKEK